MRFTIGKPKFSLPSSLLDEPIKQMESLSLELDALAKKAGQGSDKFKAVYENFETAVKRGDNLVYITRTRLDIRCIALLLQSEHKNDVLVTKALLNTISAISPKPSTLFIESLYQHYLNEFDQLIDLEATLAWLLNAKLNHGKWDNKQAKILSVDGPKWVAKTAIHQGMPLVNFITSLELAHYTDGRFMGVAKSIYYLHQLETLPFNQDDPLLHEIQKPLVYDARYDTDSLIGHQVLHILIRRALSLGICEPWLNTILAIAGDPRVPKNHPRYIKWWRYIDDGQIQIVRGWLSKLDLKLFLEAIEDFSNSTHNDELQRMYPARKQFLEGLFDAGVILNTRLYLSRRADWFLRAHYDVRHLPAFSTISDNDKSIIYVQMNNAHMIEGSHSCFLWLYKHLTPDACVFDYAKSSPSYTDLTSGLNTNMKAQGHGATAKITHTPANYAWQRKALSELNKLGVDITPKDVLSSDDYHQFTQRFGSDEWN